MLGFLEPEEFVGRYWHRWVGETESWRHFPEAAVALDAVRGSLSVFFRGLGGDRSLAIAGVSASESKHRLSFRQRLGRNSETLDQSRLDGNALYLPPRIDLFPEPDLNRALYFWLAAYFSQCPSHRSMTDDPLLRDLNALKVARGTILTVHSVCPGLVGIFDRLGRRLLESRPVRALLPVEAMVEIAVLRLLGQQNDGGAYWPWIAGDTDALLPAAPANYHPYLPVPLWGESVSRTVSPSGLKDDTPAESARGSDARDGVVRKGKREDSDQINRTDSLILNRFEKILSLIQSMNINRDIDDDDEENARKALDDADEIAVCSRPGAPATRLKFDLDLPPEAVDESRITAETTYPEWHCDKKAYLPEYCRVLTGPSSEEGEDWAPNEETRRLIRHVRRKFEALRPRHEVLKAQMDGGELDMDALVRSRSDMAAYGIGSDRVHLGHRRQVRDLAVTVLMDVSLSTDGWIDDRRILDVEKEALTVLSNGLEACGDRHSILTFTSRRRNWVWVDTVKDFDEPFGAAALRRLAALKPKFYTRIGPAIRHAARLLGEQPNRHRLLIVLTDGKPNDIDHYEGRYGIEDTRRAIQEARRNGTSVFGVTVDREAQDYFPAIFGRGGYAIIDHIAQLPAAMPSLYRHLAFN